MHRRSFLTAALGGTALGGAALAQAQQVSSTPARRDYSAPIQYPDPDVVALDKRFQPYIVGNTPIQRLFTGTLWAEGPAWNGAGRYVVWSDIPNNFQRRWLEEDGHVSVFRNPSGYSNGNTFDYEGRQLSCEHGGRRVSRYEPNGTVTVIADKYQGKRAHRNLLLAGLQKGLRGRHRRARGEGVGSGRQDPAQWQTLRGPRYSRWRRSFGGGRNPLRCGRQPVVRRAARRADRGGRRPAHRHDPPAGDLRQHLFRRPEAESLVHGCKRVVVLGVRGD
jgi:hypothetical protein